MARPAIELAERTFRANGLADGLHRAVASDVPDYLVRAAEAGESHELVIADPPNFAPSQGKLDAALESYAALHAASLKLLAPRGLYLAASCSSHVRMQDFLDSVREGARREKRVLQVLEQTGAPFDHPRLLAIITGASRGIGHARGTCAARRSSARRPS